MLFIIYTYIHIYIYSEREREKDSGQWMVDGGWWMVMIERSRGQANHLSLIAESRTDQNVGHPLTREYYLQNQKK